MHPFASSFLAATACALLAGCASPRIAGVEPIDGVIAGPCHTDRVRGAVGLSASPGTLARARIDSDAGQVQVVRGSGQPAAAATDSEGGSRLVVETGPNNAITRMRCA